MRILHRTYAAGVVTALAVLLGTLVVLSRPTAPPSPEQTSTPFAENERFAANPTSTPVSSANTHSENETTAKNIAEEVAEHDPEASIVVPTPIVGASMRTMPGETPPILAWVLGVDTARETLVIRRAQLLPADEFGDPSGPAILRAVGPDSEILSYMTGAAVTDQGGVSPIGELTSASSNLYWIGRENDIVTNLTRQPLDEVGPPSDLVE